ncbi:MAG TPA: helix-turn-helix domain-containing protein [Moheibacter sp.]|nr:helix-turn-helix domain-containing protein [Moheibacter sp.]
MNAISSAIKTEQKDMTRALSESDRNNKLLIIISLSFLLILLILMIYLIYKRKNERIIFEKIISELNDKLENPTIPGKEKSIKNENSIPNPVEEEILLKLKKFENSQKFTNPKLTISTLAVQLKTNTTYLSEVINQYKGKNFNAYINELRIKFICEKIYNHPEYLNYKISYLAEESGFTSHSSFATVFKSVTGISPSVFLREAAKKESYKPKLIK